MESKSKIVNFLYKEKKNIIGDNMDEVYRVKIRGIKPLLMHNPESILHEKEKKRGERPTPEEEAERSLYKDSEGNIVIPSRVIKASLVKASTEYKVAGKRKKTFKDYVKSGILIEPENIPLNSDWTIDVRVVRLRTDRIPRARPRFDNWDLEFNVKIIDPIIRPENLKNFIIDAGKYCGLCDFRPEFGLFELVSFEQIKN